MKPTVMYDPKQNKHQFNVLVPVETTITVQRLELGSTITVSYKAEKRTVCNRNTVLIQLPHGASLDHFAEIVAGCFESYSNFEVILRRKTFDPNPVKEIWAAFNNQYIIVRPGKTSEDIKQAYQRSALFGGPSGFVEA